MSNFYNKYPYTDFHELNLDWVIETVKKNDHEVEHMKDNLPADIAEAVNTWIVEHPEYVTTVVDQSLTIQKIKNGELGYVMPEMFIDPDIIITDYHDAIMDALQFAETHNVILAFMRDKTYPISSAITISNPVIIEGNNAIIKRQNNVFDMIYAYNVDDIVIRNLIIDGAKDDDGLVKEVAADRFCGIQLVKCEKALLYNVKVHDTVNGEIQLEGVRGGIMLESCKHITLENTNVNNNDGTGIFFYDSEYCKIIGGLGIDNAGSAISGGCDYLSVSDYTCINAGYSGISVNGKSNIVSSCYSAGCGYSGINVGHQQLDAESSIVSDCISIDNTLDGITVASDNVSLSNCYIENNTRNGVRVHIGGNNVKLSNINITNDDLHTGYEILFQIGSAKCDNLTLKGSHGLIQTHVNLEVINSVFTSTFTGSALHYMINIADTPTVTIKNTVFNGNSSTYDRGILQGTASDLTLRDIEHSNLNYLVYETVNTANVSYEFKSKDVKYTDSNNDSLVLRYSGNMCFAERAVAGNSSFTVVLNQYAYIGTSVSIRNGDVTATYSSGTQTLTVTNTGAGYQNMYFIGMLSDAAFIRRV